MPVDVGTPLKLADGTLVYPDGRVVTVGDSVKELVEVPSAHEAQRLVVQTRRKLSDLPDIPKTMNAVSAIVAYTLFGLGDDEISLATTIPVEQVTRVKGSEAFLNMYDAVVGSVLESEADDVRNLFRQHAREAAGNFVQQLKSEKLGTRLAVSREILDRGGFRPVDVVDHRVSVNGGMRIEIIKKDSVTPVIEMGVL